MSTIKALVPHLHFHGEASKAIAFYERALGAKVLAKMRWAEVPGGKIAPEDADKVMHARLEIGKGILLLADAMAGAPSVPPNGTLMLDFDDAADMQKRFDALAEGGKVTMAPHDAFWGAKFGMLVDRFGVSWMFHCETKRT